MTTEPRSDISPLQRALDELESSISGAKSAIRELFAGSSRALQVPHAADALGARFEAVREELRKYLPQQLAMRARDLLDKDVREATGEHPVTRSCEWVDAVRDFLALVANSRVGDMPVGVDEVARKSIANLVQRADRDVRRYSRLRILGVAPFGTKQLEAGTVLRFQNLDDFVDADLAAHPNRGEAVDELVMTTRGERQRHIYDAADRSRYCKWCNEEEYHPVHLARASWEESPAVRDQPWVAALKHADVVRRDIDAGLTSAQIRDEIIGKVGMMASARTPEMQARYDAALERERLDARPDPIQESVDRKVEFDLAVIAARTAIHGNPDSWRKLSIGDIRRMANFVLAHAGEGPVTPPAPAPATADRLQQIIGSLAIQMTTAVACPSCGAKPGDACATTSAAPALFHRERVNSASHVEMIATRTTASPPASVPHPFSPEAVDRYGNVVHRSPFCQVCGKDETHHAAELVYEVPPAPLVVDEPPALQDRQEALRIALDEMRRALMALRLEVPQSVADEMLKRFEAVVEAFRRRHAGPGAELVALRFFHDNVSARCKKMREVHLSTTYTELDMFVRDVLENGGQALMKPRQLDAITVTVSGTPPATTAGGTVVSAGTWTETPPVTVTKGTDGTYSVGPPPDGRPVAEHLDELAAGKVVTVRPYRCDGKHTLAICPDPQCVYRPGAEKTPEQRVIDIARRVVSRGIHNRRTLDEVMRGKDLNLLHNDLQGLIWLAEAVKALDREKP